MPTLTNIDSPVQNTYKVVIRVINSLKNTIVLKTSSSEQLKVNSNHSELSND